MHQPNRARGIPAQLKSLIRAFLLCLLLLCSQLAALSGIAPSAIAAGQTHGKNVHVKHTLHVLHAHGSLHMTAKAHQKHGMHALHVKGRSYRQRRADADLSLIATNPSPLVVNQPAIFSFTISNAMDAQALLHSTSPVKTLVALPAGFTNIQSTGGTVWKFLTNGSTITATYTGAYPIAAGTTLPTIRVTATPTASLLALPTSQQIVTATVTTTDDLNLSNNSSTIQLTFEQAPTVMVPGKATVTPVPTAVTTFPTLPVSTVTPSPQGKPTAISPNADKPDLLVTAVDTGDTDVYTTGRMVRYILTVSNLPFAKVENEQVTVVDVPDAGLSNISYSGRGWSITATGTISPVAITATYHGSYPVKAGDTLPPIFLSGTLTNVAATAHSFSNTATVSSSDDPDVSMGTAVDTVRVIPAAVATATISVPGRATATATISVPGRATATPRATVIVNGTPAVIPPLSTPGGIPNAGTATPTAGIDLSVVTASVSSHDQHVGDKVTFAVIVSNGVDSGTIMDPENIELEDVLPLGIKNIHAEGKLWNISASDTEGPAVIDADFEGLAPINPASVLPPLIITGVLTGDAIPTYTNSAYISFPDDTNVDNNIASYTINADKKHKGDPQDTDQDQDPSYHHHGKKDHDQDMDQDSSHHHHGKKDHGDRDDHKGNHNHFRDNHNNLNGHNTNIVAAGRTGLGGGRFPTLPLTGSDPWSH